MSLLQSQFTQAPIQGMLDQRMNVNTIGCVMDSSSAGNQVAGTPVKMVNNTGGVPKVVECAANTDDVYGFINFDLKDVSYDVGMAVGISLVNGGNVLYLTSNAAINRRANIEVVIGSVTVQTATTGHTIVGYAMDEATASGQLIRVQLLQGKQLSA